MQQEIQDDFQELDDEVLNNQTPPPEEDNEKIQEIMKEFQKSNIDEVSLEKGEIKQMRMDQVREIKINVTFRFCNILTVMGDIYLFNHHENYFN